MTQAKRRSAGDVGRRRDDAGPDQTAEAAGTHVASADGPGNPGRSRHTATSPVPKMQGESDEGAGDRIELEPC